MRKLDKTIRFATEYAAWFPLKTTRVYNSSNNKYYRDVLYELLLLQGGLCAYSEYRLVSVENLDLIRLAFENGRYNESFQADIPADLEHFDKSRKTVNGWDWKNFFAVDKFINTQKNRLENIHGIDEILRPDREGFDPFYLFEYDRAEHKFRPNPNTLTPKEFDQVDKMLIVLGVNNDFIKMKRREFLEEMLDYLDFMPGKVDIHQFPTAFALLIQEQA